MKKAFIIAAVAASLSGAALHYLYDLLPNDLTALISPVNESVWEHLKLLFWPSLVAASVLSFKGKHPLRLWGAFFIAELFMPVFLLSAYYFLKAQGIERLWIDIGLYFVTIFLGFFLAYVLRDQPWLDKAAGYLLMVVIFYGAALILFTFAAPPLKIFMQPVQEASFFYIFGQGFPMLS